MRSQQSEPPKKKTQLKEENTTLPLGDNSTPARFLQGLHVSDDRSLALQVYGGEVLAAFDEATILADKVVTKSVSGGMRSMRFPLTWEAAAIYHAAGQEMLGEEFETAEREITIDGLLVSHYSLYDVDTKLSHFDISGEITRKIGVTLAQLMDRNIYRSIVLASRSAGAGAPFPGGSVIVDAALAADGGGNFNGSAIYDAIMRGQETFYNKNVPEDMQRYALLPLRAFNALRRARDPVNNQYLFMDRENGGVTPGLNSKVREMMVDNVKVMAAPPTLIQTTNQTATTSVWPKYRANYAGDLFTMWTEMAVATLMVEGVSIETERDVRRQENFMVGKMLAGHGTLRPECAISFRAAV